MKIYIHHYYTDKLFFKIGHNTTNKVYNIENQINEVSELKSEYKKKPANHRTPEDGQCATITADYKNTKIEFIFNPEINDNEDGIHLLDFFASFFQKDKDEKFMLFSDKGDWNTKNSSVPNSLEIPFIKKFADLIENKNNWIITFFRTEKCLNDEGFKNTLFSHLQLEFDRLKNHKIVTDNYFIDSNLHKKYKNLFFAFTNTMFQWNELIGIRWYYEYGNMFKNLNPPYKLGYGIRAHKINRVRLAKKLVGTDGIFISQTNELENDNGQMPFERINGTYLNTISGDTDFSDLNQIHNHLFKIGQVGPGFGLDLYFRILPMAKMQILDESWAWHPGNFKSQYLSEKTIGYVLANIPFIPTHTYPLDILQSALQLDKHPFYNQILEVQGNTDKLAEFIKEFVINFDKNYTICKDWCDSCHNEFMKKMNEENSLIDLITSDFQSQKNSALKMLF
jgi:hypothetical protein